MRKREIEREVEIEREREKEIPYVFFMCGINQRIHVSFFFLMNAKATHPA
jgi:hypothetical protein